MKVLFIGGTGNISTSVSRLAVAKGIDLYHLNRGNRKVEIEGVKTITGDINDKEAVAKALEGHEWDSVVNWIAFGQDDVERDIELFSGKTRQYIFISSASVYQKPLTFPFVTESTPLKNPFWDYSRNKIACEERLNLEYREKDFPIVIVRPSLTYDTVFPVACGSWTDWTLVDRLLKGQKLPVHGDGLSLWTVTHAEDFGRGLVGLLDNEQAEGNAFHITSDEVFTWDQIYTIIGDAAGAPKPNFVHVPSEFIAKIDAYDTGNLLGDKAVSAVFDNSKIKSFVPEFKAIIPFREGIRRTLAWFEEDPARKVINEGLHKKWDKIIESYEVAFNAL